MNSVPKLAVFFSVLWLSLSALPTCAHAQPRPHISGGKVYRFINGQWFTGKTCAANF